MADEEPKKTTGKPAAKKTSGTTRKAPAKTAAKGTTTRRSPAKKAAPVKTGATGKPAARKAPAKKAAAPKTAAKKTPAKKAAPKVTETANENTPETGEAKSRFNAALEEAKAGANALRTQASTRAADASDDFKSEAREYGEKAMNKASDLAVDAKSAASDGIASLGTVVGDTATRIDDQFGEQYGDYARKASRTLQETSAALESKSVEELGEDARQFVRKSPGVAVGIAAVAGFMLARLFRGSRD